MNKAILLVEDEESDVLFMQLALSAVGAQNPLFIARDGRKALACLKEEEPDGGRQPCPLPGLVLLDLRLPYVPGLEVLRWIRQQPRFVRLPVIILSSSDQDSDVEAAYSAGANAYLVKPPTLTELKRVVRLIKKYWLDLDAPPPDCQEWQAEIVAAPSSGRKGRSAT